MKTLTITEGARRLVVEQMARTKVDPSKPMVLSVLWSNGIHNNRRGNDGNVVWDVHQQPRWAAMLSPWEFGPEIRIDDHVVTIDGVPVYLDRKVKALTGTVVIDVEFGQFTVHCKDL